MTLSQQEISKLFNSLKVVVTPSFEGEVPAAILERYPSKKRVRDHYTSRLALIEALNSPKVKSYEDLKIENHHHLVSLPQFIVSLTHTNTLAAAVTTDQELIESVGIDLEARNREMKTGILKFFLREDDQIENPLELWCLKEAAFKALSPLYHEEKQLVLKDICIRNDGSFVLDSKQGLSGYYQLRKEQGHYLALAIIVRTS